MKKLVRKFINTLGFDVIKIQPNRLREYDEFIEIYNECKPFTMTSIERMFALYKAIEYVIKNNIEGDFYECGVWRGGSSMMIAKTLKKFNTTNRKLYLFDTFEGMNEPTENDKNFEGSSAADMLNNSKIEDATSVWCYASIDEVKANMGSTGYPAENISYIKGKVEDTLPSFTINNAIAILRLDTDWYESTKMEMEYLFPSLVQSGVLIIDDYGYWEGAKKAIDEYFKNNQTKILLNRIDDTGRIAIKTN